VQPNRSSKILKKTVNLSVRESKDIQEVKDVLDNKESVKENQETIRVKENQESIRFKESKDASPIRQSIRRDEPLVDENSQEINKKFDFVLSKYKNCSFFS
jgi:hypothetical protein